MLDFLGWEQSGYQPFSSNITGSIDFIDSVTKIFNRLSSLATYNISLGIQSSRGDFRFFELYNAFSTSGSNNYLPITILHAMLCFEFREICVKVQ